MLLGALGVALLASVLLSAGLAAASSGHLPRSTPSGRFVPASPDGPEGWSLAPVGTPPSEVTAGAPTDFAWEALNASGDGVAGFALACELAVTVSANGSSAPAWVNSSVAGALGRAATGTFSVPSAAWSSGVLNLSITFAEATPVTVLLSGSSPPTASPPVAVVVLPDRDHLVLYAPDPSITSTVDGMRANATFWHVRDRFGDPAPGALLTIEYSLGGTVDRSVEPVVWSLGGTSGAWVNYSAPDSESASLAVLDAAGATLLGPVNIPPNVSGGSGSAPLLSPFAVAGVLLLSAGGLGGIGALLLEGRPRGPKEATDAEEELRRLAEGRGSVVELIRRSGPMSLGEIESAWDPPPAPPAVADWVASLVTDGTLTASLQPEGRARFALASKAAGEPRVTVDEEALERGIARRDAAVEDDEGPAREP